VGKRRKARELALEALYQIEITQDNCESVLEDVFSRSPENDEVQEFTRRLVLTAVQHQEEIDSLIAKTAENWDFSRISSVDRNVLRCAVGELLYFSSEIPPKVAINEAIEIAKKYSTADSGRFVNGILDKIASVCLKSQKLSRRHEK